MKLFISILALVTSVASTGYLTFYRTGLSDSLLVAICLLVSSYVLGYLKKD